MKKLLLALTALTLALPAGATPGRFDVTAPSEPMVTVPGLELLGPSRISTVEWCVRSENLTDWRQLVTDSDFELMEGCLLEHT